MPSILNETLGSSGGVLCVIPARGNSKRLPEKNIKNLVKKPLIAWSIDFAVDSGIFDCIVVSTDNPRIAEVAVGCGATVPWLRPDYLATDEATTMSVVKHALAWYAEERGNPSAIVVLQPTSPIRSLSALNDMLAIYNESDASVVSVVSVGSVDYHPAWTFYESGDGWKPCMDWSWFSARSQELPRVATLDGSIYILSPDLVRTEQAMIGKWTIPYLNSSEVFFDIDTPADFEAAERYIAMNYRT
jgi:CMP-N,N'-diacetyllegionaminic acid synthase